MGLTMKELKKCPKCGHYGPTTSVGSIGSTDRIYVCSKCQYQWTE